MEKKEIVPNSLVKVLEEAGQKTIVKNFYNNSKDNVIGTIRTMQDLYGWDHSIYMNKGSVFNLVKLVLINDEEIKKVQELLESNYGYNDLFEDDIFCFAAQQYLTDLTGSNGNEDTIFEIKRFLIRHTMYSEALEGSPYDLALTDIEEKLQENPKYFGDNVYNPSFKPIGLNGLREIISGEKIILEPVSQLLSVAEEPEAIDTIDEKYVNCEFSPSKQKGYQKPQFYQGCLFLSKYKKIDEILEVDTFDDRIINVPISKDFSGNSYEINDCYPIFITEKPEVGDIAFVANKQKTFLIANKEILDSIKESGFKTVYYTMKFNNRKIETLVVKRFSCGTLDKDISEIPYHVNIKYEDEALTYNVKKIADHYRICTTKIIAKEDSLMGEIRTILDHPLNIEKSEWLMLVADAGAGKTQISTQYANEKGIDYILQQGHAQLTVDDLLGYKSITDGTYFSSLLRDAVENGKIFILDEIDACNPNTLLALNSLKNKRFQFPDKIVDIHKDFRLIATANTLEYSDVYNGRSKLDKATLTRFKVVQCDLEAHHLAIRYGLEHISALEKDNNVKFDRLTPREIERLVVERKIKLEQEAESGQKTDKDNVEPEEEKVNF